MYLYFPAFVIIYLFKSSYNPQSAAALTGHFELQFSSSKCPVAVSLPKLTSTDGTETQKAFCHVYWLMSASGCKKINTLSRLVRMLGKVSTFTWMRKERMIHYMWAKISAEVIRSLIERLKHGRMEFLCWQWKSQVSGFGRVLHLWSGSAEFRKSSM